MIHLYNNGKNRASKSFWMREGMLGRGERAMRRLGSTNLAKGWVRGLVGGTEKRYERYMI